MEIYSKQLCLAKLPRAQSAVSVFFKAYREFPSSSPLLQQFPNRWNLRSMFYIQICSASLLQPAFYTSVVLLRLIPRDSGYTWGLLKSISDFLLLYAFKIDGDIAQA